MAEESRKSSSSSSSSNFLKKSASFFSCTRGAPQTTHSSSTSSTHSPPPTPPPSPPASSSSSSRPPSYFTCPISSSLMSEPVAIPSGHSFERSCIQACIDLNFTPPNCPPQLLITDTIGLTPNHTLRRAIHDWCRHSHQPLPSTILPEAVLEIIKKIKQTQSPPPSDETIQERILREIQEPFPSSQHSALTALIQNPFCTSQILAALLPCLTADDYSSTQTLAARALYVLSLHPANLPIIFHYSDDDDGSTVTHLLDIIRRTAGSRAGKFATGIIYKLAVEEAYRHAIGVRWGGIRILLDQFCRSNIGQKKAMLAIYYLCLHPENLGELIEAGGVGKLVAMLDNNVVRWTPKRYALILLYGMMLTERGREEMLEGEGIEVLVKRIAECKNGGDDQVPVGVHCLNVMYTVCRSESLMRFREVAAAAGAEEVLVEEVEEWEDVGRVIARGMVSVIRGEIGEAEELEEDELDIDVEVERVENEDSEDEEWVHQLFQNFVI